MKEKLSQAQHNVLFIAVGANDGVISRFPPTIKGGAAKKVVNSLIRKGLATMGNNDIPHVTEDGYHAIGEEPPKQKPQSKRTRANSKQAKLIELLQRPEGASLDYIAEELSWGKHTVRGAISGTLKKKLGLHVIREKIDGVGTYFIK
uniref:DUF3489 domain-containing protein n=1 Tax=Magnetococcus massalia (strain MO-1) TaxID=451514 RepID=A0A1S7LI11_MAGMO|nr:Conserved protein of unknown function [Candidatus Magnetococcus massalia]